MTIAARWPIRPDPRSGRGLPRRIVGFRQDDQKHWIAELECGHTQHVRHDPPWQNRPWVASEEGRRTFVGKRLDCLKCVEAES